MQGENGLSLMCDCLKEIGELVPENVEIYRFVSWAANLQLYEADFGWGKPIWESTAGFPFKNVIIFIETRVGYGLEAWVSMDEQDMTIFEHSQELRSFVSSIRWECLISNVLITNFQGFAFLGRKKISVFFCV